MKINCPYCDSDNTWLDDIEYNGDLTLYIHCCKCDKEYIEYRRTILEEIYDKDGNLLKEINNDVK